MRNQWVYALGAVVLALLCSETQAERRLALVIGNDAYRNVSVLQKAVNDAHGVSAAFREIGFDVTTATNVSRREMNRHIQEFANKIERGDIVTFFFAGHGVAIEGASFLLPVDIPNGGPDQVEYIKGEAISLNFILSTLEKRGGRIHLIILDACRDNPFESNAGRSLGGTRGLARIPEIAGTFIMYSAGVRQKALDSLGKSDPNPNSIFTRALIPMLKSAEYDVASMALEVRKQVKQLAKTVDHTQRPAFYNDLDDKFHLVPSSIAKPLKPTEKTPPQIDNDALFWSSIQDSKTIEDYKDYLRQFPNGIYVGLANRRIKAIRRDQANLTPAPVLPKPVVPDPPKPDRRPAGSVFRDCADCPEMVVLSSGAFNMGSLDGEPGRRQDEGPRRHVNIARRFAVGKFEVTFGEFDAFVKASNFVPGGGCHIFSGSTFAKTSAATYRNPGFSQRRNHPVSCVSWYDAKAYVSWLNGKVSGSPYRLLTEAEWEYAARANTSGRYSFAGGTSVLCNFANAGNTPCRDGVGMRTARVGSYRSNGFGLFDMHGNMWEWVEDCYRSSYRGAPLDGTAVLTGSCEKRVLRSGGWNSASNFLRSATRDKFYPDGRYSNGGFRVAKTLPN